MKKSISQHCTPQAAFFSGDYRAALELSLDRAEPRADQGPGSSFYFIVASLCFLGRTGEAEVLYGQEKSRLSQKQRIQSRLFLGIGMTRDSKYQKGLTYFAENLRELKEKISDEERFYIYMGAGFYRYFNGKNSSALRVAEKAFEAALKSDFLYGRVLSADLKGHLLIQAGAIHSGMKVLREAARLAGILKNDAISSAIDISIHVYEGEYGLSPETIVEKLQKKIQENSKAIQDTYSRSALLLELARQYLIRGRFALAAETLDRASELIYSSQNRRQEVVLHLRYAYLSYLSNDTSRGLSFVQSSKRSLDLRVDHALRMSVLGTEQRLVGSLNMKEAEKLVTEKLQKDSAIFGGTINRRILARQKMTDDSSDYRKNGDLLGDLKDQLALSPVKTIPRIVKYGYLSFLYDVVDVPRGVHAIYMELEEGSLTVFDRNRMEHTTGLTPLTRAFLVQLASGAQTKEQLIKTVWKYPAYHRLNHDPVIYQAVTTLRKLLGVHADWIQTTENGYALQQGVLVQAPVRQSNQLASRVGNAGESGVSDLARDRLNHRQIKLLQKIKQGEFINVHDYIDLFGISEITATRDLSDLNRQGFMVRTGRARATRYALASESLRKK